MGHLNQFQLAQRWNMSQRTLERWRWWYRPRFLKLGGKVVYRLADVELYEGERLRTKTQRTSRPEQP